MAFIEPCFGIGHNLSLICQMTSEDIKHHLIIDQIHYVLVMAQLIKNAYYLYAADNLCQIRIRWKQSKSETYITWSDAWRQHCCLSPFATDHTYDHDWKWITVITDLTQSANWWLASKSNITWTLTTVWEYKSNLCHLLHCSTVAGFQARSKDQEILEEGGGAGPSLLPRRDHE